MTDLVKDLRIIADNNGPSECAWAADEIERLRGLLGRWLTWAEHQHLTPEQFAALVNESQAAEDGATVQPTAVIRRSGVRCPKCGSEASRLSFDVWECDGKCGDFVPPVTPDPTPAATWPTK